MFTTERSRKQRQTPKPENSHRVRPSALVKRPLATNPYQDYEKRLKALQEVQEEQEKRLQMLQQIMETARKSTNSISLQDLEQNPAYKYCIARLKDLFKTDQDVEEWLNSHESGLPKTPMQYLEEGKFEIVERLIGMIEHGIPS